MSYIINMSFRCVVYCKIQKMVENSDEIIQCPTFFSGITCFNFFIFKWCTVIKQDYELDSPPHPQFVYSYTIFIKLIHLKTNQKYIFCIHINRNKAYKAQMTFMQNIQGSLICFSFLCPLQAQQIKITILCYCMFTTL